jgi:hypothetical protein
MFHLGWLTWIVNRYKYIRQPQPAFCFHRPFLGTEDPLPLSHTNIKPDAESIQMLPYVHAIALGREPASLEEFIAWSQKSQADALTIVFSTAKSHFPACGGLILWIVATLFHARRTCPPSISMEIPSWLRWLQKSILRNPQA